MSRTVGAAIGAVIVVLFLATVATRFVRPVSAAQTVPAPPRVTQR